MSHDPSATPTPAAPPPPDRRGVLGLVALALGGLAGVVFALPVVGYLIGPLVARKPDREIDLGPVDDYPEGETRLKSFANPLRQPWDGMTGQTAAYVRRTGENDFLVFAVNCTHLGCPVSWFPQSGLFMCPCHGGVYYANGERASGPPPHGLYQYRTEVRDGRLFVKGGHLPTLQDPLEKDQRA
jgi:menaquinol-cytochrome c reductase iron-sulfur subunit